MVKISSAPKNLPQQGPTPHELESQDVDDLVGEHHIVSYLLFVDDDDNGMFPDSASCFYDQ